MNPPTTIALCIAFIFACVAPGAAQRPEPPEQSTSTRRQDKQTGVAGRDLPSPDMKQRSSSGPSSPDAFSALSARQKKACDKLLRAAESGRTGEVRRLLARGVPADTCGTLALLMISPRGQVGPAKALLEAGADPRVWTLLHHGVILTPLKLAWDYRGPDKEEVAGELVKAMLAAERRLGWKQEYCSPGRDGAPLLLLAIMFAGDVSQVEMLLAKGADVNQKGCRGVTALMVAAERGESVTAKALIAAGADVNAQMGDGATALSLAVKGGHGEIVRLLKQAGAKQ